MFEIRQDNTLRVNQPMIATRYRKPRRMAEEKIDTRPWREKLQELIG